MICSPEDITSDRLHSVCCYVRSDVKRSGWLLIGSWPSQCS